MSILEKGKEKKLKIKIVFEFKFKKYYQWILSCVNIDLCEYLRQLISEVVEMMVLSLIQVSDEFVWGVRYGEDLCFPIWKLVQVSMFSNPGVFEAFPEVKKKSSQYKLILNQSTVAQMAERAPQDRKVPSLNPALEPMRLRFKE